MFRLALYSEDEGSGETVAILDSNTDPDDYCPIGFSLTEIVDIDGDATHFPTDRNLWAR